ncbi:Vitamin K-dependent gamma-carboxylase [Enhygromyxa salina]|uniref:Vitamin K-dependent gamma-carboxylase n=1 Tax=Enhygromyxa salina TaxID=215803 RepID=A0A2S9XCS0_9BACT|nr:HTTM domain-containing protein [Enhygromyxa salina]PRP90657.1 Vitamin K-dependent gamma-carboxylase [Enhygromyxa salina]
MSAIGPRLRTKLENFASAEISSRPLAMVRIFTAFICIYQFAGPWASHFLDGYPGAVALTWVYFILAGLLLVGYKTRVVAAAFALVFGLLHIYFGVQFHIHVLEKPVQQFQIAVLLALTPCGRSLSVDRAIEVRCAGRQGREPEPERMPWWQVELFIVQIASIYLWAAQNKSDDKWLRGERMERYYLDWYGGSDSLVYTPWVHHVAVFLAWSTTALEFVLAFGLLVRRWRPYLMWGGVMLHLGILAMFSVTYFSFMMLLILMLCLPPTWIHDFISLVIEDSPRAQTQTQTKTKTSLASTAGPKSDPTPVRR